MNRVDPNCASWPKVRVNPLIVSLYTAGSPFRYLNSGTYMGDRDAILHMLDFIEGSWGCPGPHGGV
jgi:hypothetical protein